MLDIQSISFFKTQKYNKVPRWHEISIQSHMLISLQTFHICNLLSHWALSNCCDPYWDSFHTPMIKITYTFTPYAMLLHVEQAVHLSIHKIKLHAYVWHLSLKIASRIWGYAKRKGNKRCIPKEGMPHALACQKKKIRKRIAPIQKKERDGSY